METLLALASGPLTSGPLNQFLTEYAGPMMAASIVGVLMLAARLTPSATVSGSRKANQAYARRNQNQIEMWGSREDND